MKNNFFIIFLLFALGASAQSRDTDWKRPSWWDQSEPIEKSDTVVSHQQSGPVLHNSNSIDMISLSLSPCLSIIRQQFRLERNGEYFGKNNRTYYGESFSLGIKVAGGMVFTDQVIQPWVGDVDYNDINQDNKYNPSLFRSYQRYISQEEYKQVDLELNSQYVQSIGNNKNLYKLSDKQIDFGITIDGGLGEKTGFMVWAYANPNANDSCMVVSLRHKEMTVNVEDDSDLLDLNYSDQDKILGGLYVIPKFERGCKIQFYLVGVAVKEDGSWKLQLLKNENLNDKEKKNKIKKKEKD